MEDYINRCRLCFITAADDEESLDINSSIEARFFSLTLIEVRSRQTFFSFVKLSKYFLVEILGRLSAKGMQAVQ